MIILRIIAFAAGAVIVANTVFSAIESFVVPRRTQNKLGRLVFRGVRRIFAIPLHWAKTYEERDRVLGFYAPFALLALLPVWYVFILIGYLLMFWGAGAESLFQAFQDSGSSMLTLGFAAPAGFLQTALAFSEAALGLIMVSLLIAYL